MINSEINRVARKVLIEQIKLNRDKSWYGEVKMIMNQLEIDGDDTLVMTKKEWGELIETKIKETIDKNLENSGTKSRFVRRHGQKE